MEAHSNTTESFLTLPDGRILCYAIYGNPSAPPDKTILYHHGFSSSRLEAAMMHKECAQSGFKVISFDRPGYGKSSPNVGRTLESTVRDVEYLLDSLNIIKVNMMGTSAGVPFASACAALLPERTRYLCLMAPYAPIPSKQRDLGDGVPLRDKILLHVVRLLMYVPFGTYIFLKLLSFGEQDAAALKEQNTKATALWNSLKEGLRSGIEGGLEDTVVCSQPPSDNWSLISSRTIIWAGENDNINTMEMALLFKDMIRDAELHVVPGGHFLGLNQDEQVLQSLI